MEPRTHTIQRLHQPTGAYHVPHILCSVINLPRVILGAKDVRQRRATGSTTRLPTRRILSHGTVLVSPSSFSLIEAVGN